MEDFSMTFPIISAQTAGILIILQSLLMFWSAFGRRKYKEAFGTGGEQKLEKRIRAHGNLAENAAIFLIVLALLEMGGMSTTSVSYLAGAFIVVRLAHVFGVGILRPGPNLPRVIGTMGTGLLNLTAGGLLINTYGVLLLCPA